MKTTLGLSLGVTVYRSKISAAFKNFFPILIITLISFLTFSISVKNFGQRVGICVMTLMAAVAYRLSALSGLPALGYLTLFVFHVISRNVRRSISCQRRQDSKLAKKNQKRR